MDNIQKSLRQGLQIKQTVLIDAFSGLTKMANSIWKTLEKNRQILFLGEGIAHAIAQITASQLQRVTLSLKPKIGCLALPAFWERGTLEELISSSVEAHIQEGDLFIVFAISGREPYILKAIQKAKAQKGHTLIISGQNHKIPTDWINFGLAIPSPHQSDILELHLMIGNLFCALIQEKVAPLAPPSPVSSEEEEVEDEFISFHCDNCDEVIFTESRFAGKRGTCPGCHQKLVVPRVSTVPPEKMTGNEKRLHLRFKVQDCLVGYSKTDYPKSVSELVPHALLDDLSEGGCSFLIETHKTSVSPMIQFKEKDHLFLLISIPAFTQPLRVKGEARRIKALREKRAIKVGVQFIDLTEETKLKLQKLQSSDILKNLRRASGLF